MAEEDMDGALGIKATIDAKDIQSQADEWVKKITEMQTVTSDVVGKMNNSLSELETHVESFGRSVNGISLSEIQDKLTSAKAHVVELGETIRQQKDVVADVAMNVRDYGEAYKQAKQDGRGTDEVLDNLNRAKNDYAAAKEELRSYMRQQEEAKIQVGELSKAYAQAQSSQPNFDNVVKGAESASQRISNLREDFQHYVESLNQAQTAINALSEQSASSQETGDKAYGDMQRTIVTRYIVEGDDEVKEKTNAVNDAIKQMEAAYTNSAATARVAFSEQQNLVSNLERQIENLNVVMQQAAKAGDFSSASEAAAQIQTLEVALSSAKDKLVELQQQVQTSSASLNEVGNIGAEAANKLEEQSTVWGRFKDKVSDVGSTIGDWFSGQVAKGKDVITTFTGAIDGMGLPLSSCIKGFKQLTAQCLAFISTPIGAVLGAIAIALKSVWTFLRKSAEGQKAMAKISAFFGSIMSSVTDIVVLFGKKLFEIFTKGNPIITDFTNHLVKTFKLAFSTLRDLAGGFGTMLQGVFQMDWEKVKSGFSQMGTGLKEAGEFAVSAVKTQIRSLGAAMAVASEFMKDNNFSQELTKIVDNMGKNASKAMLLAGSEVDNVKALGEAQLQYQQKQKAINEEQEKIYTLTGKAKDAQIELVKNMKQEAYKPIIDAQQKTLRIQRERMSLHTNSLGDYKKERDLQIQIAQTMAQEAASTRMLTRMQAANARSMARKSASAAKKEVNQQKAQTLAKDRLNDVIQKNTLQQADEIYKLQESIENARIAAMTDGAARSLAERKNQYREELLAIEQQRKKAVAAEINRQKAEWDASQAVIKARGGRIQNWNESHINQQSISNINKQYDDLSNFVSQKQEREQMEELAKEYDKQNSERQEKVNKLKADIARLEARIVSVQSEAEKANLKTMRANAQAQLDWLEQSKDSWNEYYSQYGTFIEKKKALDEKFAYDTIGMDKNSPEYKQKEKEYEKNTQAITLKEVKNQINWEQVFGDLGAVSTAALKTLEEQLRNLIENDKDLSIESIKEISDALDKVRLEQANRGGLARAVDTIKDYKAAKEEAKQRENEAKAVGGGSLWRRYQSAKTTEERAKVGSEKVYDPVTHKLTTFSKVLDRATKAAKNLSKSQEDAQASIKSVGSSLSQLGQIGNSTSDLLGRFGVNLPQGFGTAFNGLSAMGDAMESFDVSNPGSLTNINNYVKFATGVVDTFTGMFEGIANLFGSSGMKEYKEAKENYEKLSSIWDDLISKKKEYIDLSYGADALKAVDEVEKLYKAEETSLKRLTKAYLVKHSGNAHSQGYRINKAIGTEGFQAMSKAAGANITDVMSLFNLDYDQLVKAKSAADGKYWAEMDEESQEYFDKLIDIKKAKEDLADQLKERLTGVSFDEFKNNYISAIKDMNSSATDMCNTFKENLRDAIIDSMIDKVFKDKIQKLYDDFANANEDGDITKAEYDMLMAENAALSQDMQKYKQELKDKYQWASSETTSGSSQGFSSMTQDQASELNGRFTAMNVTASSILTQQQLDSATLTNSAEALNQIVTIEHNRDAYYNETLEIQRTCLGHLATISRNTNELYGMHEKLDKIERNTRNL